MTNRDRAARFDLEGRPNEAAEAYEDTIAAGEAELETFLNLIVLYLQCFDGGYVAHHGLSQAFVDKASARIAELLTEVERRFGSQNEALFWKAYVRYMIGDDLSPQAVLELARRGPSLVPYFHLFAQPDGARYVREATALLREVQEGTTARERYILSILKSHVNDRKWES